MNKRPIGITPVNATGNILTDLPLIKSAGFDATFFEWKEGETTARMRVADRLGLFVQSIHAPFSQIGRAHV